MKGGFGELTCFGVQLLLTRKDGGVCFIQSDFFFFSLSCSVLVVPTKYPVLKVVSRKGVRNGPDLCWKRCIISQAFVLFPFPWKHASMDFSGVRQSPPAWQDIVESLQEELLATASRNVAWSRQVWRDEVTRSFRITAFAVSHQKQQPGQTFDSQLSPSHLTLPPPIAPSSPAEKAVYTTGYNF